MRFGFGFLGFALAALTMTSNREPFPAMAEPGLGSNVFSEYNYHSFGGNGVTRVKKTNKLRYSHNAKIKRRKK